MQTRCRSPADGERQIRQAHEPARRSIPLRGWRMAAPSMPAPLRRCSGKADRSGGSGAFHEKKAARSVWIFTHAKNSAAAGCRGGISAVWGQTPGQRRRHGKLLKKREKKNGFRRPSCRRRGKGGRLSHTARLTSRYASRRDEASPRLTVNPLRSAPLPRSSVERPSTDRAKGMLITGRAAAAAAVPGGGFSADLRRCPKILNAVSRGAAGSASAPVPRSGAHVVSRKRTHPP